MLVFAQISALCSPLHCILCCRRSVISLVFSLWVFKKNKNNRFPTWHIHNGLGAFATGELSRWLVWRQLHYFSKYSRICKYGKCGLHTRILLNIHIHWHACPSCVTIVVSFHSNNSLQLLNISQIFLVQNFQEMNDKEKQVAIINLVKFMKKDILGLQRHDNGNSQSV